MKTAVKAFSFRRGDTPSLGVILSGRNIRSQEILRLPRPGMIVSWTIGWPSGAVTKTTAPNGGLGLDVRTGVIFWPITDADVAGLGAALAPYAVAVIESDGRRTTYLTGTIGAEG